MINLNQEEINYIRSNLLELPIKNLDTVQRILSFLDNKVSELNSTKKQEKEES